MAFLSRFDGLRGFDKFEATSVAGEPEDAKNSAESYMVLAALARRARSQATVTLLGPGI